MAAKLTRLTHKILIQLHLYHLEFSIQAASPETFGYTLETTKFLTTTINGTLDAGSSDSGVCLVLYSSTCGSQSTVKYCAENKKRTYSISNKEDT
jgi:hypothetical protein